VPFSFPKITRLITRSKSDIEAILQNGAVYVRRTFENATAKALAGLTHTLHQHLFYNSQQLFPDTADEANLVHWANIWLGVNARLPPEPAEFTILVTGTVTDTPVPDTTRWVRDDGVVFQADGDYVLPSAAPLEVSVGVTAVEEGVDGNTVPGDTLTLESPIAGVDADAVVEGSGSDPIGGGSDIESPNALLTRVLARIQSPPKGGGPGDYVTWAKESGANVTRAWERPGILGPGTIGIYFVQDTFDENDLFVDTLFPSASEVQDVYDYVILVAPLNTTLAVAAPTEQTLDPVIQLSPNTAAVQSAVSQQLNDLLLRESAPGGTLQWSKINEAISLATGEEDHILVSPTSDVVSSQSQLLTLGTPSYSAIP
jgi:uncharacterized phage protein gp47/JayE